MKKYFPLTILIFALSFAFPTFSFAQGMMGNIMGEDGASSQSNDGHTAREEAEGKAVWEKLQAKELKCKDLSDENFGALGEYFMGQMMGNSHEAMNNMMVQMMGKEGEEQMHLAMGKRMSGCEPNTPMPQNITSSGMMPMMMNMMMGGGMMGGKNWGFGSGWGWLGVIFVVLFWILILVGIIALITWLIKQIRGGIKEKSALEILKERYAKGEISKEEFEEKKEDLSQNK